MSPQIGQAERLTRSHFQETLTRGEAFLRRARNPGPTKLDAAQIESTGYGQRIAFCLIRDRERCKSSDKNDGCLFLGVVIHQEWTLCSRAHVSVCSY